MTFDSPPPPIAALTPYVAGHIHDLAIPLFLCIRRRILAVLTGAVDQQCQHFTETARQARRARLWLAGWSAGPLLKQPARGTKRVTMGTSH